MPENSAGISAIELSVSSSILICIASGKLVEHGELEFGSLERGNRLVRSFRG